MGEQLELLEEKLVENDGDLSLLSPEDRVEVYRRVCAKLGLDPVTYPLQYLWVGPEDERKLILYLKKEGAAQLRRLHGISTRLVEQKFYPEVGVYVVVVEARAPDGRTEVEIGAVSTRGFSGVQLANAFMMALTKATRRSVIAILGLGILDESEVSSIPQAQSASVDPETGEIIGSKPGGEKVSNKGALLVELTKVFRQLGLSKPIAQKYTATLIGREVESSKDLSLEEVEKVLEHARYLADLLKTLNIPREETEPFLKGILDGALAEELLLPEALKQYAEGYVAL